MGHDSLTCSSASGRHEPKNAFLATMDSENKVYVARAHYEGITVPRKLHKEP